MIDTGSAELLVIFQNSLWHFYSWPSKKRNCLVFFFFLAYVCGSPNLSLLTIPMWVLLCFIIVPTILTFSLFLCFLCCYFPLCLILLHCPHCSYCSFAWYMFFSPLVLTVLVVSRLGVFSPESLVKTTGLVGVWWPWLGQRLKSGKSQRVLLLCRFANVFFFWDSSWPCQEAFK